METAEVLERLKELQDILSEKYRLEELVRNAPQQLSAQEELLGRLKKEWIDKSAKYDEVRQKVLSLKADLAEAETNRENGEKGMDNITSHRDFEALDKQIKDAKEQEQHIRKDLQKEEKNLAELNETLKQDEQLIESQETDLNVGKTALSSEIDSYQTRIDSLKADEALIIAGIDEEIVFKFERIMKSDRIINNKQSKGIVAVRGNVCDGCHMILPAQFANEVRSGNRIVFCPYCSRILYYQETDTSDDEYFQVTDTGTLADYDSELADFFSEGEDMSDGVEDGDTANFDE
jgi:predicted  nucleic acid-binding Zn-ribbon protein